MFCFFKTSRYKTVFKLINVALVILLLFSPISLPSFAMAQNAYNPTMPGAMISLSPKFVPPILNGLSFIEDNPFKINFIFQNSQIPLQNKELEEQSIALIKYFLTALTVPEDELWVNLSPYEEDRLIPETLGQTEMGRDLLALDYLLKKLMASLTYPEDELGQKFWQRIYEKVYRLYGSTDLPVNTFNKVWIVPDEIKIYENKNSVYIVDSKLKVMLEEDYLAITKNQNKARLGTDQLMESEVEDISQISSQTAKEVLIEELEKEVNEGENFAQLRQIYHSLILAIWYKQTLQKSILNRIYSDQKKIHGVYVKDPKAPQKIYQQYMTTFEQGVYNYLKEEYDPYTQEIIPRKYYSGGLNIAGNINFTPVDLPENVGEDFAMLNLEIDLVPQKDFAQLSNFQILDLLNSNEWNVARVREELGLPENYTVDDLLNLFDSKEMRIILKNRLREALINPKVFDMWNDFEAKRSAGENPNSDQFRSDVLSQEWDKQGASNRFGLSEQGLDDAIQRLGIQQHSYKELSGHREAHRHEWNLIDLRKSYSRIHKNANIRRMLTVSGLKDTIEGRFHEALIMYGGDLQQVQGAFGLNTQTQVQNLADLYRVNLKRAAAAADQLASTLSNSDMLKLLRDNDWNISSIRTELGLPGNHTANDLIELFEQRGLTKILSERMTEITLRQLSDDVAVNSNSNQRLGLTKSEFGKAVERLGVEHKSTQLGEAIVYSYSPAKIKSYNHAIAVNWNLGTIVATFRGEPGQENTPLVGVLSSLGLVDAYSAKFLEAALVHDYDAEEIKKEFGINDNDLETLAYLYDIDLDKKSFTPNTQGQKTDQISNGAVAGAAGAASGAPSASGDARANQATQPLTNPQVLQLLIDNDWNIAQVSGELGLPENYTAEDLINYFDQRNMLVIFKGRIRESLNSLEDLELSPQMVRDDDGGLSKEFSGSISGNPWDIKKSANQFGLSENELEKMTEILGIKPYDKDELVGFSLASRAGWKFRKLKDDVLKGTGRTSISHRKLFQESKVGDLFRIRFLEAVMAYDYDIEQIKEALGLDLNSQVRSLAQFYTISLKRPPPLASSGTSGASSPARASGDAPANQATHSLTNPQALQLLADNDWNIAQVSGQLGLEEGYTIDDLISYFDARGMGVIFRGRLREALINPELHEIWDKAASSYSVATAYHQTDEKHFIGREWDKRSAAIQFGVSEEGLDKAIEELGIKLHSYVELTLYRLAFQSDWNLEIVRRALNEQEQQGRRRGNIRFKDMIGQDVFKPIFECRFHEAVIIADSNIQRMQEILGVSARAHVRGLAKLYDVNLNRKVVSTDKADKERGAQEGNTTDQTSNGAVAGPAGEASEAMSTSGDAQANQSTQQLTNPQVLQLLNNHNWNFRAAREELGLPEDYTVDDILSFFTDRGLRTVLEGKVRNTLISQDWLNQARAITRGAGIINDGVLREHLRIVRWDYEKAANYFGVSQEGLRQLVQTLGIAQVSESVRTIYISALMSSWRVGVLRDQTEVLAASQETTISIVNFLQTYGLFDLFRPHFLEAVIVSGYNQEWIREVFALKGTDEVVALAEAYQISLVPSTSDDSQSQPAQTLNDARRALQILIDHNWNIAQASSQLGLPENFTVEDLINYFDQRGVLSILKGRLRGAFVSTEGMETGTKPDQVFQVQKNANITLSNNFRRRDKKEVADQFGLSTEELNRVMMELEIEPYTYREELSFSFFAIKNKWNYARSIQEIREKLPDVKLSYLELLRSFELFQIFEASFLEAVIMHNYDVGRIQELFGLNAATQVRAIARAYGINLDRPPAALVQGSRTGPSNGGGNPGDPAGSNEGATSQVLTNPQVIQLLIDNNWNLAQVSGQLGLPENYTIGDVISFFDERGMRPILRGRLREALINPEVIKILAQASAQSRGGRRYPESRVKSSIAGKEWDRERAASRFGISEQDLNDGIEILGIKQHSFDELGDYQAVSKHGWDFGRILAQFNQAAKGRRKFSLIELVRDQGYQDLLECRFYEAAIMFGDNLQQIQDALGLNAPSQVRALADLYGVELKPVTSSAAGESAQGSAQTNDGIDQPAQALSNSDILRILHDNDWNIGKVSSQLGLPENYTVDDLVAFFDERGLRNILKGRIHDRLLDVNWYRVAKTFVRNEGPTSQTAVEEHLQSFGWDRKSAAENSGISIQSLNQLIEKLGVEQVDQPAIPIYVVAMMYNWKVGSVRDELPASFALAGIAQRESMPIVEFLQTNRLFSLFQPKFEEAVIVFHADREAIRQHFGLQTTREVAALASAYNISLTRPRVVDSPSGRRSGTTRRAGRASSASGGGGSGADPTDPSGEGEELSLREQMIRDLAEFDWDLNRFWIKYGDGQGLTPTKLYELLEQHQLLEVFQPVLRRALDFANWDRELVARRLGVTVPTIQMFIDQFGLLEIKQREVLQFLTDNNWNLGRLVEENALLREDGLFDYFRNISLQVELSNTIWIIVLENKEKVAPIARRLNISTSAVSTLTEQLKINEELAAAIDLFESANGNYSVLRSHVILGQIQNFILLLNFRSEFGEWLKTQMVNRLEATKGNVDLVAQEFGFQIDEFQRVMEALEIDEEYQSFEDELASLKAGGTVWSTVSVQVKRDLLSRLSSMRGVPVRQLSESDFQVPMAELSTESRARSLSAMYDYYSRIAQGIKGDHSVMDVMFSHLGIIGEQEYDQQEVVGTTAWERIEQMVDILGIEELYLDIDETTIWSNGWLGSHESLVTRQAERPNALQELKSAERRLVQAGYVSLTDPNVVAVINRLQEKGVVIRGITARAKRDSPVVTEIFERFGIDMPVIFVSSSNPKAKANWLKRERSGAQAPNALIIDNSHPTLEAIEGEGLEEMHVGYYIDNRHDQWKNPDWYLSQAREHLEAGSVDQAREDMINAVELSSRTDMTFEGRVSLYNSVFNVLGEFEGGITASAADMNPLMQSLLRNVVELMFVRQEANGSISASSQFNTLLNHFFPVFFPNNGGHMAQYYKDGLVSIRRQKPNQVGEEFYFEIDEQNLFVYLEPILKTILNERPDQILLVDTGARPLYWVIKQFVEERGISDVEVNVLPLSIKTSGDTRKNIRYWMDKAQEYHSGSLDISTFNREEQEAIKTLAETFPLSGQSIMLIDDNVVSGDTYAVARDVLAGYGVNEMIGGAIWSYRDGWVKQDDLVSTYRVNGEFGWVGNHMPVGVKTVWEDNTNLRGVSKRTKYDGVPYYAPLSSDDSSYEDYMAFRESTVSNFSDHLVLYGDFLDEETQGAAPRMYTQSQAEPAVDVEAKVLEVYDGRTPVSLEVDDFEVAVDGQNLSLRRIKDEEGLVRYISRPDAKPLDHLADHLLYRELALFEVYNENNEFVGVVEVILSSVADESGEKALAIEYVDLEYDKGIDPNNYLEAIVSRMGDVAESLDAQYVLLPRYEWQFSGRPEIAGVITSETGFRFAPMLSETLVVPDSIAAAHQEAKANQMPEADLLNLRFRALGSTRHRIAWRKADPEIVNRLSQQYPLPNEQYLFTQNERGLVQNIGNYIRLGLQPTENQLRFLKRLQDRVQFFENEMYQPKDWEQVFAGRRFDIDSWSREDKLAYQALELYHLKLEFEDEEYSPRYYDRFFEGEDGLVRAQALFDFVIKTKLKMTDLRQLKRSVLDAESLLLPWDRAFGRSFERVAEALYPGQYAWIHGSLVPRSLTGPDLISWLDLNESLVVGRTMRTKTNDGKIEFAGVNGERRELDIDFLQGENQDVVMATFEDVNHGLMMGVFFPDDYEQWESGDTSNVPIEVFAYSEFNKGVASASPFRMDLHSIAQGQPIAMRPEGNAWRYGRSKLDFKTSADGRSQELSMHVDSANFGIDVLFEFTLSNTQINRLGLNKNSDVIVGIIDDPNHGQVISFFTRLGEDGFNPLYPNQSRNEMASFIPNGKGFEFVSLGELDIRSFMSGREDLQALGRRVQMPIEQNADGSFNVGVFQFNQEEAQRLGLDSASSDSAMLADMELKEDRDYGLYLSISHDQSRQAGLMGTYQWVQTNGSKELVRVHLDKTALIDFIQGRTNRRGELIKPRRYTDVNTVQRNGLINLDVGWGKNVTVDLSGAKLAGRQPTFVPLQHAQHGWIIEVHDTELHNEDPRRKPNLVLIKNENNQLVAFSDYQKALVTDDDRAEFQSLMASLDIEALIKQGSGVRHRDIVDYIKSKRPGQYAEARLDVLVVDWFEGQKQDRKPKRTTKTTNGTQSPKKPKAPKVVAETPAKPDPTAVDSLARIYIQQFYEMMATEQDTTLELLMEEALTNDDPEKAAAFEKAFEYYNAVVDPNANYIQGIHQEVPSEQGVKRIQLYQLEGMKFLNERPFAIIADEPGLGKTVQAIGSAITADRIDANRANTTLVVVPVSAKGVWRREIGQWAKEDHDVYVIDENGSGQFQRYVGDYEHPVETVSLEEVKKRYAEAPPERTPFIIVTYDALKGNFIGLRNYLVRNNYIDKAKYGGRAGYDRFKEDYFSFEESIDEILTRIEKALPKVPLDPKLKDVLATASPDQEQMFVNFYEQKRVKDTKIRTAEIRKRIEAGLLTFQSVTEFDADIVIVDEGHRLRNEDSQQTQALSHLSKARRKIIVSGTPLVGRDLDKIYPLLHWLDPETFGSEEDFKARFPNTTEGRIKLHTALRNIMIRRRISQVLADLLPEIFSFFPDVYLSEQERAEYNQMKTEFTEWLSKQKRVPTSEHVFSQLRKLIEFTSGIRYREGEKFYDPENPKAYALDKIIKDRVEDQGEKIVIFTQHLEVARALKERYEDRYTHVSYLEASVKDRQSQIDAFQEDPNTKIFIGTYGTGGEAITLTAGNNIVLHDLEWERPEQAIHRVYRLGQQKEVNIFNLVIDGTIDTHITKTHEIKKDVFDEAIEGFVLLEEVKREVVDQIAQSVGAEIQRNVAERVDTSSDNAKLAEETNDNKGGIDLNPAYFKIQREGSGAINFDQIVPQPWEALQFDGLLPVIINITPVNNLPLLLGRDTEPTEKLLSLAN